MRKILLSAILVCASICFVHAEEQYFGVQVGFTQPTTRLNNPLAVDIKELIPTVYNGFKVGVIYDATLVAGFGYSIGLNYTFGTNKTDWKAVGTNVYPRRYSAGFYHQLEIPVDWQYKFEIARDTWLILYTGPTIQCGIAFGNKWFEQKKPNGDITTSIENRYDAASAYALKRINVTWGVGAGLQYQRYFVRGGYDFGIINPYKSQMFADYDVYTRGRFDQWQVKLGVYLFNW